MRVTEEQYEDFVNTIDDVSRTLHKLSIRLKGLQYTGIMLHSVESSINELRQMYFREIDDDDDRAAESEIVSKVKSPNSSR